MNLYLIGDPHGRIPEYLKLLESLTPGARSIALGDLYLGRVQLPELPPEHSFVRGNHDSPSCAENIRTISASSVICLSTNCFSLAAQTASWRVLSNSKYFYRDEELSESDLNEAFAIYKETSPKFVISHTAPSEVAREILKDLGGSYFLNKHADVESRTSRALQQMFEAHQPSVWYFGHFHINRKLLIGETKFRCLAEMATAQVSEVFSTTKGIR